MNKVKNYIRTNYTPLMVSIIVLSNLGSLLLLNLQNTRIEDQSARLEDQNTAIISIAKEFSETSQEQHDKQDERQACFFNVFVSYIETHEPIDRANLDSCSVVTERAQESNPTTLPQRVTVQPATPTERVTPNNQPQNPPAPTAPPEPQQPEQRPILGLPLLDGIVNSVTGLLR